jgi:hypothetical protein
MNEDVLPCGPLDKTIPFGPVEPLNCALLSHKKLLSPLLRLRSHILSEARASSLPPRRTWSDKRTLRALPYPWTTRKAPELRVVRESTAQSSGACHGGADCDGRTHNINPKTIDLVSYTLLQRAQNNIQEPHFWQEKNLQLEMRLLNVTPGFIYRRGGVVRLAGSRCKSLIGLD